MKYVRRTGATKVYQFFYEMLIDVKRMRNRATSNGIPVSEDFEVRVDPQSRAEALAVGDQHLYTGSVFTGMYRAAHKATPEQIAEAKIARQFGYHRQFACAKLVDVFMAKNGSLCISLGGVVTRRNQKDPNKKMYRTFNLDDGTLKSFALQKFELVKVKKQSNVIKTLVKSKPVKKTAKP